MSDSGSSTDDWASSPVTILQPSHKPEAVNTECIQCQCGKLAIKRYVEKFDSSQVSQGYFLCASGKCKFFLWASNVPSAKPPLPPTPANEAPPPAPAVGEAPPRRGNTMCFRPPAEGASLQAADADADEADDDAKPGVRCQCQRFAQRHAVLVETATGTQVGQGYYTCARGKCKFFLWAAALNASPTSSASRSRPTFGDRLQADEEAAEAPLGPRLQAMLTVLTSLQAAIEAGTDADRDLSRQSERLRRVQELVRRRLLFNEELELLCRALKTYLQQRGGKMAASHGPQSVSSLCEAFVQHVEFIKNM